MENLCEGKHESINAARCFHSEARRKKVVCNSKARLPDVIVLQLGELMSEVRSNLAGVRSAGFFTRQQPFSQQHRIARNLRQAHAQCENSSAHVVSSAEHLWGIIHHGTSNGPPLVAVNLNNKRNRNLPTSSC